MNILYYILLISHRLQETIWQVRIQWAPVGGKRNSSGAELLCKKYVFLDHLHSIIAMAGNKNVKNKTWSYSSIMHFDHAFTSGRKNPWDANVFPGGVCAPFWPPPWLPASSLVWAFSVSLWSPAWTGPLYLEPTNVVCNDSKMSISYCVRDYYLLMIRVYKSAHCAFQNMAHPILRDVVIIAS